MKKVSQITYTAIFLFISLNLLFAPNSAAKTWKFKQVYYDEYYKFIDNNNDSLYPISTFYSTIIGCSRPITFNFSNINHYNSDSSKYHKDYFKVGNDTFYIDDITGADGKYDAMLNFASMWKIKVDTTEYCLLKGEISGMKNAYKMLVFIIEMSKTKTNIRSFLCFTPEIELYNPPAVHTVNDKPYLIFNIIQAEKAQKMKFPLQ